MKRPFIFFILLWCLALPAWAVDIAGTVNTYVKGDGDVAAGATTISYTGSFRGATSAINTGDLLLLIQSQGAAIDSSNTDTYGDGVGQGIDVSTTPTSLHGTPGYAGGLISQTAGTFEYATVASVSGSQVTLTSALKHAYYDANEANWQIIVVPDYLTAGATLTADITGEAWDGDTGGVIAFNATGGILNFNGFNVNASGIGFRGGVDGNTWANDNTIANVVDVTSLQGGKGEGIAGTPKIVYDGSNIVTESSSTLAGGDFGRGAPGNAGGGAGPHNSGGGGGSNAGAGGSGAQGWVGGTPIHFAGYGGQSIFAGANMGGGGGSGDANDNGVVFGGIGGGAILIRADSGTGSGTLDVSGADAPDALVTSNFSGDGAGGGGAAGTIFAYFSSPTTLASLNIDASGGSGGDASLEHGGGGGGGAGLVAINTTVGTINISGGTKGANQGVGGVVSEPGADGVAETSANAFVRLNTDFGDAPDSYGTISGGQGAYHFFADYDFNGVLDATEQLRLGVNLDGEGGGNPGTGANSDDTIGVDDEDGVSGLTQVDPQGSDYTISASNIIVTNTLASTATLHAWIDFDLNGTFDSDEYTSIPIASGLNGQNPATDLVWNTMPGITAVTPGSTTYLRLRLSTDSSLDATRATGEAENGEVEDYTLTVYDAIPTAQNVTRSNPTASITKANQLVFAVTFSENVQNVDTADFSVSGAGSTGASVSAVSGSGSSYTVTVDVANTDGLVNLDIAATTGIQDLTGNNLSTVTPAGSVESYTLDNTAPVISLQGTSPVNVILGGSYSDQGATASDNVDGDLTGSIVTSGAVNTAAPGTYIISYNVSDAAGNAATPVTRTVTVAIGPAAAGTSLISASPVAIAADGSSTSTITVQLKDVNGNNLTSGGDVVALSTTAGTLGSVTDNGNGTYSATLTSSTTAGTATITGTVNAASITDSSSVTFTVGAATGSSSLITASPTAITADGSSTSTISVQLKDVNGNNLTTGGDAVALSTTAGTLGSVTDNGNGTYSATLTSSTTAGSATISGTVNAASITDNASVTFTVGAAAGSSSLITANPTAITADGSSTSIITVQLKDVNGNNLTSGGDVVTLSSTAGTLGSVTDNGNGTYSATLTSSTTAGAATISGTINAASITDSASVAFIVGAASGSSSLIMASPTTITADGSSTSTITVQLKDAAGNNLISGGDVVTLSTTAGNLGSVTDNGDGTYSATLTSSSSVETATISATLNSSSISDTASVNFVVAAASASTSLISASPDSIIANGSSSSTITVQLKDAAGNNLTSGGDVVTLSTTAGTLGAVTDNGDGTYSAILTSGSSAASASVTGTVNSAAITDTETVSFTPDPSSDEDGDGIANGDEGAGDFDNDGVLDFMDLDSDNDGIPDAIEGNVDTDGDGIPDYLDLDSDNDGIYDLVESGADYATLDTLHDGMIDSSSPVGANGLADAVETSADSGMLNYNSGSPLDSDADGVEDFVDLDSDNDGLTDVIEAGGVDPDADGIVGNGVPTVDAYGVATSGAALTPVDNDGDGVNDQVDLDSDNDGIMDVVESGGDDPDGDGQVGNAPAQVDKNGLSVDGSLSALDTDGDGVPNQHDLDSDNDGIPDVTEAGANDADGDGIPGTGAPTINAQGIANGQELTPTDTNADSILDPYNLDSDGDGIYDLVEGGGTDSNNDGLVDGFTDSNGDGFDDGTAASALPVPDSDADGIADYQDNDDADNDSIPDSVDIDDDNDGIPDALEGDGSVDTDNDGIPDSLDLDSDNDGLYDLNEAGLPNPSSLDSNHDGRLDSGLNVGSNGLVDSLETIADSGVINYNGGTALDTDADGVKDFRDLDSDNDSIPDVIESDGVDGDGDGVLGTGSPAVNSNGLVTGAGSEPLDTDSDGIPDQQDLDTDNDGIPDLKEVSGRDSDNNGVVDIFVDSNGDGFNDVNATVPLTLPDSDGDGTPDLRDSAASNGVVSAGLNGIGAFNVYLLGLLGVLAGLRRTKLLISSVLSMLVLFVLPGQAIAQQTEQPQAEQQQRGYQRHFYIGAGLGRSTLQPDTSGTAYTLGDDSDTGYRLYGGMDLSESFSVELSLSDLGSADLKPTGKLDYSINAVNVLYYLYNQGEMKHVGMAAYLKASLGKMDVSADIPYELKNSTQIALGAGLEYAWENGFAVRADLESFDEDASILSLGLLYRFGRQQKTEPKDSDQDGVLDQNDQCPQTPLNAPVNLEGCQLDSDKDGVVNLQDQCPQTHTGAAVDSTGCELDTDGDGVKDSQDQCPQTAQGVAVDSTGCALDSDGDGVIDTLDQCPATPAGISVDKQGCPLFNAPLTGVNFKLASAELTSSAKLVLNDAAKLLLQYPAVHIEIQAHTDSQGKKANNQKLSELRAQSVFEFLQSKGIEAKRMTPVGFGESMPLVSNRTVEGRAKNRRVEFKVIQ